MKDTELRKKIEAFFDAMSEEEFHASLKRAKFDHYKHVRVPIFSEPATAEPVQDNVSEIVCEGAAWQPKLRHSSKYLHVNYSDMESLFSSEFGCFVREYCLDTDQIGYLLAA